MNHLTHWIETQSWIPESLQLWIEIGLVIVMVVVAIGIGLFLFGGLIALIGGAWKAAKNFWRWMFLAPVKYLQSWWPVLDSRWEAWKHDREVDRAIREEEAKFACEERGKPSERIPVAFAIDKHTLAMWERAYLVQRGKGETFRKWFAGRMESLAMTSALTSEAAFFQTPEKEKMTER